MALFRPMDDMHNNIASLHKELEKASDRPASYLSPILDILIDIRTELNRTASALEAHQTQIYRVIAALEIQCDELKSMPSILSAYTFLPEREKANHKKGEKILAELAFKEREEKRRAKKK